MQSFKSPLFDKYIEAKAKIINFAGWEMPISFAGLVQEHNAVRKNVGFFDISHMGVISIKGINPKDALQKFFPTNLYSISTNQSCYSFFLNEEGGIIDDLIIYDLGIQEEKLEEILLIVNASRYEFDIHWLNTNINNNQITISDGKQGKALIALQGENTYQYFEEWSEYSIKHLQNFGCEYKIIDHISKSKKIFFSKTGYTGENGLEILLPDNLAQNLWDFLISKEINPCGLGARDTLRLEAGLPLYGQDLNEEINPYEAGFGWVVNLENNHDFIGKNSLIKNSCDKIKKKLVGIEVIGKAIARKNCKILKNNICIGYVSSGSWSPSLQKPIALGYVNTAFSDLNSEVELEIRGKLYKGIISKKAFYKKI